jgi:hypothetical protein
VKPVIAVLWILSIALAVGLTRLAGPDRAGSEPGPYASFDESSGERPSFDEVFGEREPLRRAYLLSRSLQALGPDDLPELLRALAGQRSEPEELRLVMHAWARFDAPGAYAWASEEAPTRVRSALIDHAIYAWAYHDGPAAMRVVEEVEDPDVQGRLRSKAIDAWIRSDDRAGVSEFIANYPQAKRRVRFMKLLAGEVVATDGKDAAMRWVEAIPDDTPNEMKLAAFHNIAKLVAAEDPVRAGEWFLAHRTRPYTEKALTGIARRWVQRHPNDRPAAFEWLLAMDSDGIRAGERGAAIGKGFRSWMQMDPEAAQSWLLSAVPNAALDPAVREAFKRLLPTDPAASMAWAQRLGDEAERHAESVRVGVRWRGKDPDAFDAWLAQSDLPEETRQEILAAPQSQQRGIRQKKLNLEPAAAGKP